MIIEIYSIIIFVLLIIIDLINKYLEENGIYDEKINRGRTKINTFVEKNYKLIFIILIILVFFSRIYKFGEAPKYIGVDEAGAAYDAYCLTNYGVDRYLNSYPLYLINFLGGQSALYAYSTIPFIKLFGANLITYRLPELIFFIMGIIVSYLLVKKVKDKKVALLYAFLIIICPWHIYNSREGLDCNLLSPMFMLNLFLLITAKKDYNYVLAGISIGITLYTYCLAWILIPVFLVVYLTYMIYLKKINFKQILCLGIPIFIFAIPLFYLIALNKGIFSRTNFGIFTIPKLPLFRQSEISIFNIFNYFKVSLRTLLFEKFKRSTIYLIEIPFLVIGIINGLSLAKKSLKEKKFEFDFFIVILFIFLLLANFTVVSETSNRLNILFLPMLYIITIGIETCCNKSYLSKFIIITTLSILFINFQIHYFRNPIKPSNMDLYRDNGIMKATEKLKKEDDAKKYILSNKVVQPYIYTLVENKISPYQFIRTRNNNRNKSNLYKIESYDNYYFTLSIEELNYIETNINNEKYIFMIGKEFENIINKLNKLNLKKQELENYYIFKNY